MSKISSKYKHPGGVIGFPREALRSPAFKDLSSNAKALMFHLQDVWKPYEPYIHYSVRRAGEVLGLTKNPGTKALKELRDHGFIVTKNESNWLSGQARVFKLTWVSVNGCEPTNEWKQWKNKI